MSLPLKHTYTFDSFVLDVEQQILLRDGRQVPMTPKVFETLLLLVQHQGSIVTKETILHTLWPDVFVEESNITFNITKLRKALGDTKRPALYIETIPRRGYRFKPQVREVLTNDISSALAEIKTASSNGNDQVDVEGSTNPQPTGSEVSTDRSTLKQLSARTAHSGLLQLLSYLVGGRRIGLTVSVVAALVLLGIAVAAGWRINRALRKEGNSDKQLAHRPGTKEDLKYEQITAYGNVVVAAISPDAKQVAYVQENTGRESVWLIQLGSYVRAQLIPPGDSVYNEIRFSHSGDYVYFAGHAENGPTDLYRVPTLPGPPTKLFQNVEGAFSLSFDDREVVFKRRDRTTREDSLYLADLSSGRERLLVTHKEPDWIRGFSISPDGKLVVYATGETDSSRQTIMLREVNVETGAQKFLLQPNWYFVRQIEWLSDGKSLLLLARENAVKNPQIWRMSYPDVALEKLTDDSNNYLFFSADRDATKIIGVQSVLASHIWVSDVNGRNAKNVVGGRGRAIWTANGQIIYSSGTTSGADLWIVNPDGTNAKQLSFNAGFNDWPAVSPDGRTIVFHSNRTGVQHLWRMNLDGSNLAQLTNGYAERNAAISPDGKWIYFNSPQNNFLWKIPFQGGEPIQLTKELAAYPFVSPNGKLIACFRFPKYAHQAEIIVRKADDMTTVAELKPAPGFWISRSIQWEPDSAGVVYAVATKGKLKLYRQSISAGLPQEMTTLAAEDEFEFSISPNGKQLAFTSSKWNHDAVLIEGIQVK
jgi:Tol biopolymer transport system component/DNA-binding winged helix-turn-helix (wHTH) protein